MKSNYLGRLFVAGSILLGAGKLEADIIKDDFNKGSIDSTIWNTDGYDGGYPGGPAGMNQGGWQHSFTENTSPNKGLTVRTWGPDSGNTYGSEAILGFNEKLNGKVWDIEFNWQNQSVDNHVNQTAVLLTNGNTQKLCNWFWTVNDLQGSLKLYSGGLDTSSDPSLPYTDQSWSIGINSFGFASLYTQPNLQGSPFRTVSLDQTKDWYLKFILDDGTSAGYGAGDSSFKLNSFTATNSIVPEPSEIALLSTAVSLIAGYSIRRKMRDKKIKRDKKYQSLSI